VFDIKIKGPILINIKYVRVINNYEQ